MGFIWDAPPPLSCVHTICTTHAFNGAKIDKSGSRVVPVYCSDVRCKGVYARVFFTMTHGLVHI